MSLWNKILVGLILVVSLGFGYLAMRTLKTHQSWRERAQRLERQIQDVQRENKQLESGSEEAGQNAKPGIRQLNSVLTKLTTDRGRVWYNCTPQKANPQSGEVSVTISAPDPHGIADKTTLYAFEEATADKGGRYLGQFVVSGVAEKQVGLTPVTRPGLRELQRVVKSTGPWALYERMPFDNHDAFSELSEAEKKALLPAETVTEYLKDGQPAGPDDPKDRVVDGKYVRPLRDYALLFAYGDLKRTELADRCASAEHDKDYMLAAAAEAKKDVEARTQEIAKLKSDLERDRATTNTVAKLHDALQRKVAELTAAITQTVATNKSLAAGIAKIQWEATRRIDERTRAMAQAGDGGK